MTRRPLKSLQGFVLLPVVIAIVLVAAIALLISRGSAINVDMTASQAQADQALYVAEAGFQHASWQLQGGSCTGYTDLPATAFGDHSYQAAVLPVDGSPVTITAEGVLDNGTRQTLVRTVNVHSAPIGPNDLQPGPADGLDVHITEDVPTSNLGGSKGLTLTGTSGKRSRGLLKFDLSTIPTGSRILGAEVSLYLNKLNGSGDLHVHRVTRAWDEATATWLNADASTPWSNAGGDFDSNKIGVVTFSAIGMWYTGDVTSLVQEWLDNPAANFGMLMMVDPLVSNAEFTSSDEVATPTLYPKLTVTYVCECGATCTPPVTLTGNYRDEFNSLTCDPAVDYIGSDGTLDWTPHAWSEFGDDGQPCMMAIRLVDDTAVPDPGSYRLQLKGMGKGVERRVDLSGFSSADLSFDYRRLITSSMAGVDVDVSPDDGLNWFNVGRIEGIATDSAYQSQSIDISAHMSDKTKIRFTATALGMGQLVYLDNIMVGDGTAPAICDGNYAADTEVGNWDNSPYGSLIDITYVPGGVVVNGVTIPAGGGWALVDGADWDIEVTDLAGTLLTTLTVTPGSVPFFEGIHFVSNGVHGPAFFLVSSDTTSELTVQPADGSTPLRWVQADKLIGTTYLDAGDYQGYFLSNTLVNGYVYDATGNLVGNFSKPADIGQLGPMVHLPGGNLVAIQDRSVEKAWIAELSGTLPNLVLTTVNSFDVTQFGIPNFFRGLTFNPDTCEYVLLHPSQLVKSVNEGGGGPPPPPPGVTIAHDTYLRGGSSTNYGTDAALIAGRDNGGPIFYPLVKFQISSIPPGTLITSATLRLYQYAHKKSGSFGLGAHRIDENWMESGANWSTSDGATAWAGGVGGTFSTPAVATTTVTQGDYRWYEWDVTALVQEWVDNPPVSGNYGIQLVYTSVSGGNNVSFASREHADSSLHPQLVVDY